MADNMREIAGDVVFKKERLWSSETCYTLVYDDDEKIRPLVAVRVFYNDDVPRRGRELIASEMLFQTEKCRKGY